MESAQVFGVDAESVAAAVAALVELVEDPTNERHKGGESGPDLALMVEDLREAGAWLVGWDVDHVYNWSDQDLIADFLDNRARPRKLAGARLPDEVGYRSPDRGPTGRDHALLVVAALRAWLAWVAPDPNRGHWLRTVYLDACHALWLRESEWSEVRRMGAGLDAALAARYTRRRAVADKGEGKGQAGGTPATDEQGREAPDMPASTVVKESALGYARSIAEQVKAAQYEQALRTVAQAAGLFPEVKLPKGVTWAKIEAGIRAKIAESDSVADRIQAAAEAAAQAQPQPGPEPERAAQTEPQPAPEPARELVGAGTLAITHTVTDGTILRGIIGKDHPAVPIIGRNGLKWRWFSGGGFWYIYGSRGGSADRVRIDQAERALRAAGLTVTVEVDDVDPATGQVPAPKVSKAELARRQRAHSQAYNSIAWYMSAGPGATCRRCGAEKITMRTGRIKDIDGMPAPVCLTCEPEPMPEQVVPEQVKVSTAADVFEAAGRLDAADLARAAGDRIQIISVGSPAKGRTKRPARQRPAAKIAEPVAAPREVTPGRLTMVFGLESGASRKHTARELRRELHAGVVLALHAPGAPRLESHVYPDGRRLTVTVIVPAGASVDSAALGERVTALASAVRGVLVGAGV